MKILQSITIGGVTLKNRIMFPPLTTGYEDRNGNITDQSCAFYERLAKGGTGYIVIGDVNPVKSFSPTPRLYEDGQIESFRRLTDAVHAHGAKIGAQIFYPEYDVEALGAMAASGDMMAVRKKMHYDMEHFVDEVTEEKLLEIIEKMTACACRAREAGFDAIQIHGDRLVGVLCSTKMNHRTDRFGGSLEHRVRFARLLVQSIRKAVPELLLEYKFSVITPQRGKGGIDLCDAIPFAQWLQEDGVHMLHVAQANHTGNLADTIPPMGVQPYGFFVEIASKIKDAVNIPVSVVGRIVDPNMAEAILESGKADIIAVGRPLLCDPDWGNKIAKGKADTVRRCIFCNKGCTDAIQNRSAIGCVLNAENGKESAGEFLPAEVKKHIIIVGGGIAGLEAARVAAFRGHDVVLYEKSYKAGGQIDLAAIAPRKGELTRAVEDLVRAALEAGATLHMGTAVTEEKLIESKPDAVMIAVGAKNAIPPIPGAERSNVFDAWQVLSGDRDVYGHTVVIGGGLVGCETAEHLAKQGIQVSILELFDQIASGESTTVLPTMMEEFEKAKVGIHTGATVESVSESSVCYRLADGTVHHLVCDCVVMATGARSVSFETTRLQEMGIPVAYIGDCAGKAVDISNAIRTAYAAACAL